ncbi:hypothetical protein DRO44_00390 [Candidatus Bathyarchaeota archaeon]|nr:MAG: hypothetical protein DRO44_00390 [Candidatus Bathyarchaeota archaeon]
MLLIIFEQEGETRFSFSMSNSYGHAELNSPQKCKRFSKSRFKPLKECQTLINVEERFVLLL